MGMILCLARGAARILCILARPFGCRRGADGGLGADADEQGEIIGLRPGGSLNAPESPLTFTGVDNAVDQPGKMAVQVKTIGLVIAKSWFQVDGVNDRGQLVLRKKLAELPRCS